MKAVGAKIPDKELSLLKMLLVQTIVEDAARLDRTCTCCVDLFVQVGLGQTLKESHQQIREQIFFKKNMCPLFQLTERI